MNEIKFRALSVQIKNLLRQGSLTMSEMAVMLGKDEITIKNSLTHMKEKGGLAELPGYKWGLVFH